MIVPRQRTVSDSFSTQMPAIKNFGHCKHNRLRLKANRMILDRGRVKPNLKGLENLRPAQNESESKPAPEESKPILVKRVV